MPNETPASVVPLGTVETMLLDELRRARETTDKVNTGLAELNTEIKLMRQEREHDRGEVAALKADYATIRADVVGLQNWRSQQAGERSAFATLLGSPVVGWIVAAAALVYSKIGFPTN